MNRPLKTSRIFVTLAGIFAFFAPPLFAWKPSTHAMEVKRVIDSLPEDDPLRQDENRRYAYAGAAGPDIFYFLIPSRESLLSDLAHYCKTDVLARNILTEAKKTVSGHRETRLSDQGARRRGPRLSR